ncbi:YggS family pyridoxal phosphate-dependent enzyme [Hydrogenovibrio sp. SC-1]|uniref:YggS family pyridoxal phosphate-dependent enzyme n=1 Tax=Hydrogenovibrio sp. SC-1 TaxID=2065820 RepID=UPI000C7C7AC1|nr:YggS family pyridoxal phosphate-dependent enzyme [Hydrogenovibrio sp. SC-1]PLA74834.1 YggS family pyridoxal phosphate-dependent enzyme [Hydrogenovibrio sp. SC-1]
MINNLTNAELIQNYQTVLNRIKTATAAANRPQQSVQLLAVSKTKPLSAIEVLAEAGQKAFGENYLQEALTKIEQRPDLEWHFIGPIQSNKTRPIAELFQWVHSVDRYKIARRLSDQRPKDLPPLNILLEVNISEEDSKAGFSQAEVIAQAAEIAAMPNLSLRGLMAIPAKSEGLEAQRQPFQQMQQLLKQLQALCPDSELDTLSMGMSADLEAAILEGATLVRIGTDLFGARR